MPFRKFWVRLAMKKTHWYYFSVPVDLGKSMKITDHIFQCLWVLVPPLPPLNQYPPLHTSEQTVHQTVPVLSAANCPNWSIDTRSCIIHLTKTGWKFLSYVIWYINSNICYNLVRLSHELLFCVKSETIAPRNGATVDCPHCFQDISVLIFANQLRVRG